jgi:hypothetical protein
LKQKFDRPDFLKWAPAGRPATLRGPVLACFAMQPAISVFQTPELSIQDSHERYARFDHHCTVVARPIRKRHVVARLRTCLAAVGGSKAHSADGSRCNGSQNPGARMPSVHPFQTQAALRIPAPALRCGMPCPFSFETQEPV